MHRGGDTAGGAGGLLRCHLPPLEQSPSYTGAADGTWEVKGGKKLLPAWYEDGMVWSRCSFLGSLGLDRAGRNCCPKPLEANYLVLPVPTGMSPAAPPHGSSLGTELGQHQAFKRS